MLQNKKVGAALAMEFVSIVVGVLFALALSEWVEDRQNRLLDAYAGASK